MIASFESWISNRFYRIDECAMNVLSSSVVVESSNFKTSFFDGVLNCCAIDMVVLLRDCFRDFSCVKLRAEVRLRRSSRISLDRKGSSFLGGSKVLFRVQRKSFVWHGESPNLSHTFLCPSPMSIVFTN